MSIESAMHVNKNRQFSLVFVIPEYLILSITIPSKPFILTSIIESISVTNPFDLIEMMQKAILSQVKEGNANKTFRITSSPLSSAFGCKSTLPVLAFS